MSQLIPIKFYSEGFKMIFDFFGALLLLLLLVPFILPLWLLLIFVNNGKAFFYQERAGKNGKAFRIVKFKTMECRERVHGNLLPNDERITPLGRVLRKYSLDELPQLLNVLSGNMSFIGPRPLHMKYLPLYNAHQSRRHEVKPGITGWAQVNGRNSISWEDKFNHDVWYIDNISFILDLRILWLTIGKILKKEGVNQSDSITMAPFLGSPEP